MPPSEPPGDSDTKLPGQRVREAAWRVASLVGAVASLVTVVTCGASTPVGRASPAVPAPSASLPGEGLIAVGVHGHHEARSDGEPTGRGSASDAALVVSSGPLGRFSAALQQPNQKVRILWWGDSHSAADILTQHVRAALQERFGSGGPGFIHVGIDGYPHAQVLTETTGRWRSQPAAPSAREPALDGVFGLGGIRAQASAGAQASIRLGLEAEGVTWTVYARPVQAGARVVIRSGLGEQVLGRLIEPAGDPRAGILSATLAADAREPLDLAVLQGSAEIYGIIAETSGKVVLDELGINGARAATPLAWDQQAFVPLIEDRAPTLVVLAYGTNEVFDGRAPEHYFSDYEQLMSSIRMAAPSVDCVFVGPTDVARGGVANDERVEHIAQVQREAARELGCAFFDAAQAMGGRDGFEGWRSASPQLAQSDGVHLTRRGYRKLGDAFLSWLYDEAGIVETETADGQLHE